MSAELLAQVIADLIIAFAWVGVGWYVIAETKAADRRHTTKKKEK